MKEFISIILMGVVFTSCSSPQKSIKSKNIELIKKLAFCKCLEYNITNFVGTDTLDISADLIQEEMSIYGGKFVSRLYPLIDSSAKSIFLLEKKARFDSLRHESAFGKVGYKRSCIDFYKSNPLDSLAKEIYKKAIKY
jgi:hypothetical protein